MKDQIKSRFTVVPAAYVIFRNDGKVLLLRRANTGYFDGSYSLPAGHIAGGESAIDAAVREAKEEVGVVLDKGELKFVHVMHRASDIPVAHERVDFYFQTRRKHPEITNREPHKCDELRWAPILNLPHNMIPEVKMTLEKVALNQYYSDLNLSL